MRQHLVDNLGVKNRDTADWMLLYKQGFFVDWRMCDRLKKTLFGERGLGEFCALVDWNLKKNAVLPNIDHSATQHI